MVSLFILVAFLPMQVGWACQAMRLSEKKSETPSCHQSIDHHGESKSTQLVKVNSKGEAHCPLCLAGSCVAIGNTTNDMAPTGLQS